MIFHDFNLINEVNEERLLQGSQDLSNYFNQLISRYFSDHMTKLKDFFSLDQTYFIRIIGQPADGSDQKRKIPREMKQHFPDWLAAETGLKDFAIGGRLAKTFETLFEEIESELSRMAVVIIIDGCQVK